MSKMRDWQKKAALVRKWSLVSTTEAGSGHPTSCLSAADICTVLFDKFFTYDIKNPKNPTNDRFILSKGHAAPLLYALFALSGGLNLKELNTLRKFGSRLEGHPTPNFPFTEAATGSLGQGLSIGAGIALNAKKDGFAYKTYVLIGDGESEEGNIWEAINFASYNKLNNLIIILDLNRLELRGETMLGHHVDEYINRFSAFNFEVVAIDGHNFSEIEKAFNFAINNKGGKPFVIIAKTKKGKGVSFLEDKDGWHGKPLNQADLEKALKELGEIDEKLRFKLKKPESFKKEDEEEGDKIMQKMEISYKKGQEIATREAFGDALTEVGKANPLIFALDADVSNSTFTEKFRQEIPNRFIQCFISEQNMVGVSCGLSRMGKIPVAATFASFFTRGFDQIRMAAISKANIKFVGSHAGVSIGEDGASQMGLEDIAMFGAIPDSVILHPCDAVSTAKIIPSLVYHDGISYLRTLRPKTPVIYKDNEKFKIGGAKVLRKSENDLLTVAATGITVFEALKAYEELKKEKIMIRVVDCYSIKPIDKKTLFNSLESTKKRIIITVEDHFSHGGLGDFVLSALAKEQAYVEKMAVEQISCSGTKDELLNYAGINARHIVKKVKLFIGFTVRRIKRVSAIPLEVKISQN